MHHVEVVAVAGGRTAAEVFPLLTDMRQYPKYSETVLALDVASGADGTVVSTWTVKLGPGTATWTQQDMLDAASTTIHFKGISGDIDYFKGAWTVRDNGAGCILRFDCDFDIGLPGLGALLEPRIGKLLRENIRAIFSGMFGAEVQSQD